MLEGDDGEWWRWEVGDGLGFFSSDLHTHTHREICFFVSGDERRWVVAVGDDDSCGGGKSVMEHEHHQVVEGHGGTGDATPMTNTVMLSDSTVIYLHSCFHHNHHYRYRSPSWSW